MVKRSFIEKLIWAIIFSIASIVLMVVAILAKNFNTINGVLMAIFVIIDSYFIYASIKFYKYLRYEKIALSKDKLTTATFLDKKCVYKLGDFNTGFVVGVYKVQFSFVNELGEMIIDESLAIFSKEQALDLENRQTFNVFEVNDKKAIIIFDRI